MGTVLKILLGMIIGWTIVHIIGSVFALVETYTGIPMATAYLGSGLVYPVGVLIYGFSIYKTVTF